MANLQYAGFEVLDAYFHIWAGGSFGVPIRYGIVHIMGKHKFPTPCIALFAHIAFPVDDF